MSKEKKSYLSTLLYTCLKIPLSRWYREWLSFVIANQAWRLGRVGRGLACAILTARRGRWIESLGIHFKIQKFTNLNNFQISLSLSLFVSVCLSVFSLSLIPIMNMSLSFSFFLHPSHSFYYKLFQLGELMSLQRKSFSTKPKHRTFIQYILKLT